MEFRGSAEQSVSKVYAVITDTHISFCDAATTQLDRQMHHPVGNGLEYGLVLLKKITNSCSMLTCSSSKLATA